MKWIEVSFVKGSYCQMPENLLRWQGSSSHVSEIADNHGSSCSLCISDNDHHQQHLMMKVKFVKGSN